jgi:hypothetical protein
LNRRVHFKRELALRFRLVQHADAPSQASVSPISAAPTNRSTEIFLAAGSEIRRIDSRKRAVLPGEL